MSDTRNPVGAGAAPAPPPAHEPPPPGAHFMNIFRWVLFVFLLLLAVASIGSYVAYRLGGGAPVVEQRKALYRCPMHPSYTSDKPGECPICGMTLEPVSQERHAARTNGDVPGLVGVTITPERIQRIGVRTAVAARRTLGAQPDLVGFVTPDESRLKRVQLRVAGWIQQLYVNRTGQAVRAGQPLLSIYSPELFQSESEYLIELPAHDSTAAGGDRVAESAGRERLRLLGVPEEEIRRLERERKAVTRLTLAAPFSGTVLERGVVEGQYVGADTPLLTVADLSRVWVLADLYEMDLARVGVGDVARFTADALPQRRFDSKVEFVYPTVSNESRTVKARLSVANADGALRPGMYGSVSLQSRDAPVLAIPTEAVVRTGEQDYVFLAHPGGHFEPRMVWTGAADGDWVEIRKGLAPGDTVVASASFLIDSESRLKAAIEGLGAQPGAAGPHVGMPGMRDAK
jgi:Cu(I)/Ag(I) efflux system membrane fusion protein